MKVLEGMMRLEKTSCFKKITSMEIKADQLVRECLIMKMKKGIKEKPKENRE
jgi:hypothetical protein